jgi:peptide/nickel transport system substrate-binding protein
MLAAVAKEKDLKLPLKLSLAALKDPRPYLPQPMQAATFIKDSLAEIGITVETQLRNVNQHFDYVMAGKHELALAGWQTDNNDVDNFLYQLLHSKNISEGDQLGNNISFYRNDEVDRLLSAGQTELDQAKRVEIYHQAQQLIFDDAPTVPLAHGRLRCAQSDRVQGYILHPTGLIRLRLAHFGGTK